LSRPHVGISYISDIPEESFSDFSALVQHDKLAYKCESRPRPGPFACVEWLMPTVVVVFIAKGYFDGFLKEAGKDHYHLLKEGLKNLAGSFIQPNSPETQVILTDANIKTDKQSYSTVFSIYAELKDNLSVKLLLENDFSKNESKEAVTSFLELITKMHEGVLDSDSVSALENARVVGKTLLAAYNPVLKKMEIIDPIPQVPRR